MQRPYVPQPQQIPQNSHQMQPQPQQQPQISLPQIQDIRYATEEEAKAFIVFPNASAYFIDLPKNRLYIKSANASGISNIDYFDLTPINADGTPIKPQEPAQQVNFDDFVKKDQIPNLGFVTIEQYESLLQRLDQIQKRLEGVRPNNGNGNNKQHETRV
jgi:hypothetical protein